MIHCLLHIQDRKEEKGNGEESRDFVKNMKSLVCNSKTWKFRMTKKFHTTKPNSIKDESFESVGTWVIRVIVGLE